MTEQPKHIINQDGSHVWRLNGYQHREDGPSYIGEDIETWRINGILNREGGPAVIWAGGRQAWYVNGQVHRLDGPAYIEQDGTQTWFIHGRNITQQVKDWMQQQNVS
jgi:hypothetical protein